MRLHIVGRRIKDDWMNITLLRFVYRTAVRNIGMFGLVGYVLICLRIFVSHQSVPIIMKVINTSKRDHQLSINYSNSRSVSRLCHKHHSRYTFLTFILALNVFQYPFSHLFSVTLIVWYSITESKVFFSALISLSLQIDSLPFYLEYFNARSGNCSFPTLSLRYFTKTKFLF